ncbi:MAG: hypothetical protein DDT26_01338 [Dehalococcoidia bacterium]|nr:hypothetical protein [Chloroflexota bacterium]
MKQIFDCFRRLINANPSGMPNITLNHSSNTVCFSTFDCSARRAFFTRLRRSCLSSSLGNAGFPNGCGIATAGTMRLAPTVREMGTIAATCTTGNPTRSISFTSVAPQRVSVPQVEVRITPSTPADFSSSAIALPNLSELATEVALPTVT